MADVKQYLRGLLRSRQIRRAEAPRRRCFQRGGGVSRRVYDLLRWTGQGTPGRHGGEMGGARDPPRQARGPRHVRLRRAGAEGTRQSHGRRAPLLEQARAANTSGAVVALPFSSIFQLITHLFTCTCPRARAAAPSAAPPRGRRGARGAARAYR